MGDVQDTGLKEQLNGAGENTTGGTTIQVFKIMIGAVRGIWI